MINAIRKGGGGGCFPPVSRLFANNFRSNKGKQSELTVTKYIESGKYTKLDLVIWYLTLFDIGGGASWPPQNVFDHCAQTLRRRKPKLGDF